MNPLDRLKEILVDAGLLGIKYEELCQKIGKLLTRSDLQIELQLLNEDRKVDKYLVPRALTRGRPATYWRATTRMLEDD